MICDGKSLSGFGGEFCECLINEKCGVEVVVFVEFVGELVVGFVLLVSLVFWVFFGVGRFGVKEIEGDEE